MGREVGLASKSLMRAYLERAHRRRLEAQVRLEVLGDLNWLVEGLVQMAAGSWLWGDRSYLADEALERELADQELRRLLK